MTFESIASRIVSAVARAEDVEPVAIRPPLAEVVDPDALERLVDGSSGLVRVTFDYCGWTVEIRADGSVDLSASPR